MHTSSNPPPAVSGSTGRTGTRTTGEPIFFWKAEQDYGFLCQWYRCTFTDPGIEGVVFTCAEQYMMYRKCMHFNDTASAAAVLSTSSPRAQKAIGRRCANFDSDAWDAVRVDVVRRGNRLKFASTNDTSTTGGLGQGQGQQGLRQLLLATGDAELVEASPHDKVWGIGLDAASASRVGRKRWGRNLLGGVLMDVREQQPIVGGYV
ncbi:hypothetical protein GGR56DRAFT_677385 [Xylariaceae sp. FL0804]|nr:hypothetical protein GGR56DRAFT_677385 [Xylariaceae sp. FL0804]